MAEYFAKVPELGQHELVKAHLQDWVKGFNLDYINLFLGTFVKRYYIPFENKPATELVNPIASPISFLEFLNKKKKRYTIDKNLSNLNKKGQEKGAGGAMDLEENPQPAKPKKSGKNSLKFILKLQEDEPIEQNFMVKLEMPEFENKLVADAKPKKPRKKKEILEDSAVG